MRNVKGTKRFHRRKFELILNTGDFHLTIPQVESVLYVIEKTLEVEGYSYPTTISMSLVTPEIIRELNREYRGKDRVTDVLSFPIDEQGGILGDVVLCPKKAYIQARLFGNSYEREVCYLTCHSILHLLGHDHMFPLEKRRMRMQEKAVMRLLDIQ